MHFLDVTRALLMILGVPFHASLVYSGTRWLVTSPDANPVIGWVVPIITSFRMPGFFLIAGFFGALLLERRAPGQWLRARVVRLGVPLATSMALLVPLQDAMLAAGPSGVAHLPTEETGVLLSYLWFLPVLLLLCAALALAWRQLEKVVWPDLPLWLLGLGAGFWTVAILGEESLTHVYLSALWGLLDLHSVLLYAPYFLLGVAARRNPAILRRLTRRDWPTFVLGLAALLAYGLTRDATDRLGIIEATLAGALAAVCLVQALLAFLAAHFDRPSPAVDRLVDASFSIYLFHHPIVIGLALLLLPVHWPAVVEWLLVSTLSLAIAYALHRAMRRSGLLLFLFNGVPLRSGRGMLAGAG